MVPEGIVTTGWPRVEHQLSTMGIVFDPWQVGVAQIALGKRKDGIYAATVGGVVLSIPRQVGKTYMIGALIFALCILFPRTKVVWTAHHMRTSTQTFRTMQGFARRRRVVPHVVGIRTANGEQEITFANGSIIMIGARAQGFGRGFDEVDVQVFDEAQILEPRALEDMIATSNQAKHPAGALIFYMGTPPRPTDPSDAFLNKRTRAVRGQSKDTAYIEMSADRDADLDDWAQWAKANASYPHRTPKEAIMRMRENLPDADAIRREGMGIWDSDEKASFFGDGLWAAGLTSRRPPYLAPTFAVARDVERTWTSIGYAEATADGKWHLAPVERRRGVHWLEGSVRQTDKKFPDARWVVATTGPASSVIDDLERILGADRVLRCNSSDICDASADIHDYVQQGRIEHRAYPELDESVSDAEWRVVGDRRAIGRKNSDASLLEAVALALWGATRAVEETDIEPSAVFV